MILHLSKPELRSEDRQVVWKIRCMIKGAELQIAGQPGILFCLVHSVSGFEIEQGSFFGIKLDLRAIILIGITIIRGCLNVELVVSIEAKACRRSPVWTRSQGVQGAGKSR